MGQHKIKTVSTIYGAFLLCCIPFALPGCKDVKQAKSNQTDAAITLKEDGFTAIFDGRSLDNWEGDPTYWSVENGNLTGTVTPRTLLNNNTFIIWQGGEPDDFELKLEYRITEKGNSGINYRSNLIDTIPFALRGYQADIDGKNNYTGQNYEEKKRTTLAYPGEKVTVNPNAPGSLRANVKENCWQHREVVKSLGNKDRLKAYIKNGDWNKVHLVVKGNRLKHYINGILMSDVTDNDTINRSISGKLGIQVHVGPPMKVEFRNIQLKTYCVYD